MELMEEEMNCLVCKKEMMKFEDGYTFYCKYCDITWDGYSKTQYPPDSFIHARAKLSIEWMALADAIKKELLPIFRFINKLFRSNYGK